MNIHPALVHFPIALLTIYSAVELVRFRKIVNLPYWFYLKASFLFLGIAGALAALATGDLAEESFEISRVNENVVSIHATWAEISTIVYGAIAFVYFLALAGKILVRVKTNGEPQTGPISSLVKVARRLSPFFESLANSWLVALASLIGLASIAITGALGASMVYGPSADPFVGFVYNLFAHF